MGKAPSGAVIGPVNLQDGPEAPPLYRQVYLHIRRAILGGQLPAGSRLPSTRVLAQELGVSRNTVAAAFDQLYAEGFIEGRVGSGSYVTDCICETLVEACADNPKAAAPVVPDVGGPGLSRRGAVMANARIVEQHARHVGYFRPGSPALDAFPHALWQRLVAKRLRLRETAIGNYGPPAGYEPLRRAVAGYLATARGVVCSPDQVIITAGAQAALDLCARILADPGDKAWIEDPGYLGARGAFRAAGLDIVPVPVDEEGLDVAVGEAQAPHARLAYITPSRQYPTGPVMSVARRLALLDWARRNDAWIIEDDYDSEYRYCGRPLTALQGLDGGRRVFYIGTFSKVLFPDLRLGYLVVPEQLVGEVVRARAVASGPLPVFNQAVVADFMEEGHFTAHIRRMRSLYAERQEAMVEAGRTHMAGMLDMQPAAGGLQLIGRVQDGVSDLDLVERAGAAGMAVTPLSQMYLGGTVENGLILGFAAVDARAMNLRIRQLAQAIEPAFRSTVQPMVRRASGSVERVPLAL